MKSNKCYLLMALIGIVFTATAQPYGNEWIDFNQRYFKINIGENGIYRLSRADLENFGFPVSSADPRSIQLFYRGQEVAIHVSGQLDGVFNATDYLEFYAEKADGRYDTPLYINPESQPHTYYNLFSDSAAYFLTYKMNLETGIRMDDFDENNISGLTAENYHLDETLLLLTNAYYEGQSYGAENKILLPTYDRGEGWTGSFASRGQSINHTLTGLLATVEDDITPTLEVLLVGGNNNGHEVTLLAGPDAGTLRTLTTVNFNADENFKVTQDLEWSDINSDGSLLVRATVDGIDGAADRVSVSYIKVTYSKAYDMTGESESRFVMKTNAGNKSYIEVSNSPAGMLLFDITDPLHPISIGINENTGSFNAVINNTTTSRVLYAQGGVKNITQCKEVFFRPFNPADYNYLMISHPSLRGNTSSGQGDQVEAYKTYRESTAGGGHRVLDMDMDVLFNQFNYGHPSPMAIRNFCKFIYDNGTPEFLFLIGKASNVQANYYRQNPSAPTHRHFIPTYGYPGADLPFTEGFDGTTGSSTIATGRINASQPDHIEAYLNKVKEEEALPFKSLRQKNLVHISGGHNESELRIFRNYTTGFARVAEGPLLGGEAAQISKSNNEAVELINISNEINDGVMMVTFFGHSSGSVTDIEIGLVSDPAFGYSNKGKYPVFLVNGCLAGDFFSENESFGVDWVLTPNLGALAFMAHSYFAYSNNLKNYTQLFYQIAFSDINFIGRSVGEIKKETEKRFIVAYGTTASPLSQAQLVNLQGDPAVKIFGPDKPDFDVNENTLQVGTFDNSQPLATTESFFIDINIRNYGIYAEDPFYVEVVRTLADGSTLSYGPELYDQVLREDTIRFTIDNKVNQPAGLNTFLIKLDPANTIEEMDESNNTASIDIFLASGSTFNLLPAHLSIQNESTLDFYFQSSNLLVGTRSFDIQIDTLATFGSPYLTSQTMSAEVIGKLSLNLEANATLANGTVVYWRTRFSDPLPNEGKEWTLSSFVLDKNRSEGWAQSNPAQLQEAQTDGLTLNPSTGNWDFLSSTINLQIQNYGANHPVNDYKDTEVLLNGQNYFVTSSPDDPGCRNNTINFMALKRQSLVPFNPVITPGYDVFQPLICGFRPQVIYNYTPTDLPGIYGPEVLIDNLDLGDHVLIFSLGAVNYSTWPTTLKDDLVSLGFDRVALDNLKDGEPVIMLGAKNAPASSSQILKAVLTPEDEQQLNLNQTVAGSFDSGSISSGLIGPASAWSTTSIVIDPSSDNPLQDTKEFKYYGIRDGKTEVLLGSSPISESFDLSMIDAQQFPYLRLQLDLKDDVLQSPHQLHAWQVNYEAAPEGTLLIHDLTGVAEPIEVQEGQPHKHSYTYWNFSKKDFKDSIDVRFNLLNVSKSIQIADSLKLRALPAGDSVGFEIDFVTRGNPGLNDLTLSSKALNSSELYPFNNAIRIPGFLEVNTDDTNPVIDVSFDGIQIMNGDIVSPTPNIEVHIADENPYLVLTDTTGIHLYLKAPCDNCDFERIPFSRPAMQWTPASDTEDFVVTYSPDQLSDGKYGFRVLASDASGNPSGLRPYEINFEVINESTITNFYPYPNPFSSSTRFVFTLTGSEIPEDIKIQILTISGRVVKEIFMDELGPVNIGNNQTQYAWDGRDNFGDQLANGVYLYRVLIKNAGENFRHRETSADRGFKNGFGKLYLLR